MGLRLRNVLAKSGNSEKCGFLGRFCQKWAFCMGNRIYCGEG
jgi:hypothetical protein